jgi:hypothetical protein
VFVCSTNSTWVLPVQGYYTVAVVQNHYVAAALQSFYVESAVHGSYVAAAGELPTKYIKYRAST